MSAFPRLLFADDEGTIYDHPHLEMMGASATRTVRPKADTLASLPGLSRLYFHPGCPPWGWDPQAGKPVLLRETRIGRKTIRCNAVSAFMQQGWVRLLLPAMDSSAKNYTLPMWAYSAVGFADDCYWAPTFEIDPNPHWDPEHFDDRELLPAIAARREEFPRNRLVSHLERCAREYHCFAAKNFFLRRWEAPIPTSPTCNADCIGCISLQTSQDCPSPQQRIDFVPSVSEIAAPLGRHLREAPDPIVSFGQGCEGEPILQWQRMCAAIRALRAQTAAGTINLNTNGSVPAFVEAICDAGLDSIRVSLNSAREPLYTRYYRPRSYRFADVCDSIRAASQRGVFTMLNYLIFPGITDQPEELDALCRLVEQTQPQMIHFKNLNIDPDLYLRRLGAPGTPGMGIEQFCGRLRTAFPDVQLGYFNRSRESFTDQRAE